MSAAPAELKLNNWNPLWRAMRRAAVGFCESYVAGDWDSPAPERVFEFYLRNRHGLDDAGRFVMFRSFAVRAWHLLRPNNRKGSKRNIEAHYDLGNEFYRFWLDETMSYSSAFFADGAQGLEEAQTAKYQMIADSIALSPGQSVLEVGCGWGGFAKLAADRGADLTGITLSDEQLAFARQHLDGRATFLLQDYRDTQGTFDRLVSIEMIEAVGESNWPAYFKMVAGRLKPGGLAAIQAITIDERLFPNYRARADFIQRHIFPGGMLLTKEALRSQAESQGLTFEIVNCFGHDYARTLKLWRQRFDARTAEIAALGFDNAFQRKWRLYLAYCEAGFSEGVIDVGVYRFMKPGDAR